MGTNRTQLEAIELGDDGGQWIVRGTTNIDTAIVTIVRLLADQLDGDHEYLGNEVATLVEAAKTAQAESHWYLFDDGVHEPVLRLAEYDHVDTLTFTGVLFGQDRVEATR